MGSQAVAMTKRQEAFRRLVGAFRAELSPMGARAYVDAFKDYPDERLVAGIDRAIQQCPTFPSVAVLREHVKAAQPPVDTVRYLPGRIEDGEPLFRCHHCQDSGWVTERGPHTLKPEWEIDYARRCGCAMSNPAVLHGTGVGAR